MKLKEWREDMAKSAADIAEELGCTRQAVAKWEGGSLPAPAMLPAIVVMTDGLVTPNDWFDFSELVPVMGVPAPAEGFAVQWRAGVLYRAGQHPPALTAREEIAARMGR